MLPRAWSLSQARMCVACSQRPRTLAQGLVLPRGPPRGTPPRSLPSLAEVDRFSGYLVTSEFEDTAPVVPGSAVIPDGDLHHPEVSPASYASDLGLDGGRIDLAPSHEVGFPFKALLGLRELQHSVVMVHLVSHLLVGGRVFPVAPEGSQHGRLVHVIAPFYECFWSKTSESHFTGRILTRTNGMAHR